MGRYIYALIIKIFNLNTAIIINNSIIIHYSEKPGLLFNFVVFQVVLGLLGWLLYVTFLSSN